MIEDDDFKEALIDVLNKINDNLKNIAGSIDSIDDTLIDISNNISSIEYHIEHWKH